MIAGSHQRDDLLHQGRGHPFQEAEIFLRRIWTVPVGIPSRTAHGVPPGNESHWIAHVSKIQHVKTMKTCPIAQAIEGDTVPLILIGTRTLVNQEAMPSLLTTKRTQ